MGLSGALVLLVSGALLAITLRNLLGRPIRFGIVSGWIAMVGFAALAAFCFWKAQELRTLQAVVGAVAAAQKFMVAFLVGLILSSYGIAVQRRRLRRSKPPAVTSPS